MANRNFNRYQALTKEAKALFAQFSVAAAGAPTLNAPASLGITSIVRNSAGRYTITLDDKYNDLLQITQSRVLASGAPGAVGGMIVRSEAVDTDKTIVIEFVDSAGAAIELVSGSLVRLKINLKNSSVQR